MFLLNNNSLFMSQIVRISINKKLANVLEVLRTKFPVLDDSEIFKLTLSDYYANKIFNDVKKTEFNELPNNTLKTKKINLGKITQNLKFQKRGELPKGKTYKDIYYSDMLDKYNK